MPKNKLMATVKKQIKTKSYKVVKDVGANDKCPPQAKLIVDTIKAAGGSMTREDLLTALKRPVDQGGLKTNQTAERILGFYKPRLTEMGVLTEVTDTKEIEVEVPDKPAKEAKTAQAGDGSAAPANVEAGSKGEAPAAGSKEKGAKGGEKKAA